VTTQYNDNTHTHTCVYKISKRIGKNVKKSVIRLIK